jgi:hypothetical protein
MTPFRSLTANRRPFEEFKARMPKAETTKDDAIRPGMDLHLFEWSGNNTEGREKSGLRSAVELEAQSEGAVRVM